MCVFKPKFSHSVCVFKPKFAHSVCAFIYLLTPLEAYLIQSYILTQEYFIPRRRLVHFFSSTHLRSSCSVIGSFVELRGLSTSKSNLEASCWCTRKWNVQAPENRFCYPNLHCLAEHYKVTLCNASQDQSMASDWFDVVLKQLSWILLSQSTKFRDNSAAWKNCCKQFKAFFFTSRARTPSVLLSEAKTPLQRASDTFAWN